MEIIEAKEKMQITQEEIESLRRYQGFWHTTVNTLCNMEPNIINELNKSGWRMLETEDEVRQALNDFVNIYSAMYKSSRGKNFYLTSLVRGTSNKDVGQIGERTNQFLSTTTSEEIAKTFTHYGDDAILRISIDKDVPCIDMTPYKNEGSRDEHEILVSPFCEVVGKKMISKWEGYTYYSMGLNKSQLQEKSEEELNELKEYIIKEFSTNMDRIKEYIEYGNQIEVYDESYKRASGDKKEQKDIIEQKAKDIEKSIQLSKMIQEFKIKLRDYLEGSCRQKEIEIDKDGEKNKKENEVTTEEKTESKRQKTQIAHDYDSEEKIAALINLNKVFVNLSKKNAQFEHIAQVLSIPYTYGKNIGEIKQKIDAIKNAANRTNAKDVSNKLGTDTYQTLQDLCDSFEKKVTLQLKEEVYKKAMFMIKSAKISQYKQQYQMLSSQKIGFLGRLQGKEKLRQEQMRNIELRINGENIEEVITADETNKFSIRNILAEIYMVNNYELGGGPNQELVDFYNAIKSVFKNGKKEFSDEFISSIAQVKMSKKSKGLIDIDTSEKTRSKISRVQESNKYLESLNIQKEKKIRENYRKSMKNRENPMQQIIGELARIEGSFAQERYYSQQLEEKEEIEK